ncbi:slingshot dual specificity phosphatase [Anopheles darlingi]|uniref:protein-serine/threonine phosphatase n=1 Tax=Anopheles darlingi TaxID=43151 RepID=W5JWA8_ANODA|nr:slingshot dual specificity phosphatase [Anopheles darlingi]
MPVLPSAGEQRVARVAAPADPHGSNGGGLALLHQHKGRTEHEGGVGGCRANETAEDDKGPGEGGATGGPATSQSASIGDHDRPSTGSRPASSCSSSSSSSSDVQQHLQSMCNLLRKEETLKMAVKLESLRPGRTRYLVVVSRTVVSGKRVPQPPGVSNFLYPSQQPLWPSSSTSSSSSSSTSSIYSSTPPPPPQQQQQQQQQPSSRPGRDDLSDLGAVIASCESVQCDSNNTNSSVSSGSGLLTGAVSSSSDCIDTSATQPADAAGALAVQPTSANSGKDIVESCLLGIDCNERTTVGLVLKLLADTSIRLDGDGGFMVSSCGKQHIFKPVSVQTMWSALQTLHKISSKAREHNFYAGGPSHDWVAHYEAHIDSDRSCLNEWNAMDSLESRRPPSPDSIRSKPTKREETESVIRSKLKELMVSVDLDDVTSKFIRSRLEELLDMDLGEYKPFIDIEMLVILGQMDAPTEIFEHVYLGSEWNACNLEELQRNGVRHILNVTREIDNFFPGQFNYYNVRVYDDEKTDLLRHWDNTFKYILRAKMEGSKVLVHCKMGISRSASVVIAYAMKANGWGFERALRHVKSLRSCIKPNKNFMMQLETYQGMLDAMKNREKLQRSKSETNLKLAGAKEGRLLPGSKPTPLIQALNGGNKGTVTAAVTASLTGQSPDGDSMMQRVGVVGTRDRSAGGEGGEGARVEMERIDQPTIEPLTSSIDTERADLLLDVDAMVRGRTRNRTRGVLQQGLNIGVTETSRTPDAIDEHAGRRSDFAVPFPWSSSSSRLLASTKRHKSMSPDALQPRWPSVSGAESGATTPLGRSSVMESSGADAGATVISGGRRKHQSFSLEHLHGGALELRSAAAAAASSHSSSAMAGAEPKTIRMPCGNGENYSVSPNQIMHLQDKLPVGGRRGSSTKPIGVKSSGLLRWQLNMAQPTTTSTITNPPVHNAVNEQSIGEQQQQVDPSTYPSAVQAHIDQSRVTTATASGSSSNSSSITFLTVKPSSTASAVAASSAVSTSTVPSTTGPGLDSVPVSSVRSIVSELESGNVGDSSAITTTTTTITGSGNIPVAPPSLPQVEAGCTGVGSAAIPIGSVAAEAAAVAVAAAAVSVVKTKEQSGIAATGTSNPEQWDPGDADRLPTSTICWTSSAQIIQQSCTLPPPLAHEQSSTGCSGSSSSSNSRSSSSSSSSKTTRSTNTNTTTVSVARQCSWSGCDVNVGLLVPSGSGSVMNVHMTGGPCLTRNSSWGPSDAGRASISNRSVLAVTEVTRSGTEAYEKDEIPWHPGTVKRTKERIEERSSVAAAAAAPLSNAAPSDASIPAATSSSTIKLVCNERLHAITGTARERTSNRKRRGENDGTAKADPNTTSGSPATSDHLSGTKVDILTADTEPNSLKSLAITTTTAAAATAAPAAAAAAAATTTTTTTTTHTAAGKVRDLKMSFEAKTAKERRKEGQKKVRSLPSSPVAIHIELGQSKHSGPAGCAQTGIVVANPTLPTLVRQPSSASSSSSTSSSSSSSSSFSSSSSSSSSSSASSAASASATTANEGSCRKPAQQQQQPQQQAKVPVQPPEDVTVRDLVDRYEVHVPRLRTSSSSSSTNATSTTMPRQRPRSVFEPLKSSAQAHFPLQAGASKMTGFGGGGSGGPLMLSHSTALIRTEDFSRPPVPPTVPLVRGLVLPCLTAVPPSTQHSQHQQQQQQQHPPHSNNNNNVGQHLSSNNPGPGSGNNASNNNITTSNNHNNNNNNLIGGKRMLQHGRTHPLAKINPTTAVMHHQQYYHNLHYCFPQQQQQAEQQKQQQPTSQLQHAQGQQPERNGGGGAGDGSVAVTTGTATTTSTTTAATSIAAPSPDAPLSIPGTTASGTAHDSVIPSPSPTGTPSSVAANTYNTM